MNERRTKAIVVGCGIGGPVAAIALTKIGLSTVVYEAHLDPDHDRGSFLNTASNGVDALRLLGIGPRALEAGFSTPRMVMWSGTGKRLGDVANGRVSADGSTSVTIERRHLYRGLRDEASAHGIRIAHGKKLDGLAFDGDGVRVSFADGSSDRADLVVGADGIHSRVRTLIDPSCPEPRYTGQLSVGGITRGARISATPGEYHMIFGKRAFFGYSAPRAGEVYWFANVAEPETTREALAAVGSDAWKARLGALFEGDAGPAIEAIAATEHIVAYPIFDMPRVPIWRREGAVLLGDAAHATSPSAGQGAALAIEDALVLAKCLRDVDGIEPALAAYEAQRRPRVEKVVKYSARVGGTKVPGPFGRWLRDLVMPYALSRYANSDAHAWLYDSGLGWDERAETG